MANISPESPEKQLDFRVFLDSKEIGYHRVSIKPSAQGERISVEAKFDVKVLFVTAFSYLHTAEEYWENECLKSIDTQTTENSDQMFVRSEPTPQGLAIDSHLAEISLSGCIRSFAYWDHPRLNSELLLNTQTGEHVPAKFSSVGEVLYKNEGTSIAAKQYLLEAEGADINLWYSMDNEWLALKTKVKGGRVLAYHRIIESDLAEDI